MRRLSGTYPIYSPSCVPLVASDLWSSAAGSGNVEGALRDRVNRYKNERNKDLCNRAWLCGVAVGTAIFHKVSDDRV